MKVRPRPHNLEATCGFNRSGRALVHRWTDVEWYMVRNTTDGEPLRLEVLRCLRCGAFRIHSRGGDADVLAELLEFAAPVPRHSGWCSPEQPACVDHSELPPRQKRRTRARRQQRRDAA